LNENISRTEAHKIFAALYRKVRSPEHQAKVDEIITRSNDVFIRIDLIRKLDEDFEKKSREQQKEQDKEERKQVGNQTQFTKTVPSEKQQQRAREREKENKQQNSGGFIERLFGGNNELSKFAKETKSIDLGLLGRKPTISPNVEKLFKFLKEEEIIGTAQALKYSEQVGWRIWTPAEYNVIINFGRFFNAFISLDSLFKDEISPEVFLGRSTKMIMYYIRMLNRPDTKDIILEKVPALIKMEGKLVPRIDAIMRGLTYALTLENRRPTLKDSIMAFYVVMNKKVPLWEEIEKSMNAGSIDESKYTAPPDVLKQIEMAVAKLTNDINSRVNISKELSSVRKNFFKFLANGDLDLNLVDKVINDHVAHYYADNIHQQDSIKSSIRNNPPKLLQTLCRDIQTLYLPTFEGYIKLDINGPKDVLVVQPGLLFPEIDKINNIIRGLDAFNRKFQSFIYSFEQYANDLAKGTTDQVESQLIKLMTDASDFFGKFAKKLTVIIENDNLAREYEKSGNLNEKTLATKEKVIEEIKIMQRFIPYGDKKLVTQNRLNGVTVRDMLFELTCMLYNYAILFRDESIIDMLSSHTKIESELSKFYIEYERLAGKPYTAPGGDQA
jgi:hypothetical protein